ncbi:ankyrin repeat and SAM domain-containing protein 4B-like [Oculina patagonica]
MGDLYHKAARDSVLELLKTATKRDANRRDEDGMSPVHYAASCGNVEALRLLVGKGGEPNRPNHDGATAVHLAASCGQLNCLTFLTNFGANIWALDNDGRTPLEEAALHGRMECVRHLDGLIAIQMMRNKKEVDRLRRQAKKDMTKRIKKQDRSIQSRESAYEKKVAKETRARSQSENGYNKKDTWNGNGTSLSHRNAEKPFSKLTGHSPEMSDKKKVKSYSSETFQFGSKNKRIMGALRSKFSSLRSSDNEPKMVNRKSLEDAGLVHSTSQSSPSLLDQLESKVVENQHQSLASDSVDPDEVEDSDLAFGHVVKKFDDKGNVTTHVHYLPKNSAKMRNGSVASRTSHSSQQSGSSGHLSSSFNDIRSLKSIELEDDTYSQSDMGTENTDSKTLVTFMASLNLEQFSTSLINESIDLNTLALCSDEDLKDIGLPLGPRRKILDAVNKRNVALNHPGPMTDSKI